MGKVFDKGVDALLGRLAGGAYVGLRISSAVAGKLLGTSEVDLDRSEVSLPPQSYQGNGIGRSPRFSGRVVDHAGVVTMHREPPRFDRQVVPDLHDRVASSTRNS